MEPVFSQQYCTLMPCQAGGIVSAGRRILSCLVEIVNGQLFLIHAPDILVGRSPVPAVEIGDPPPWAAKVGTSAFVYVGGQLWEIDFSRVGRAELKRSGPAGRLLASYGGGSIKSVKRARELSREFVAALLREGAIDGRLSPAPADG
jgi:hypothetical protein